MGQEAIPSLYISLTAKSIELRSRKAFLLLTPAKFHFLGLFTLGPSMPADIQAATPIMTLSDVNERHETRNINGNFTNHGGLLMAGGNLNTGGGALTIGSVRLHATDLRNACLILEALELIICIIILGITGSAADGMKNDLGLANIPGKLGYNIGIAAVSLLAFLITIPLDLRTSRWLGYGTAWEPWPRVSVNSILTIFWIGTIPASFYTCNDLCSAAGGGYGYIEFATLYCECGASQFGFRSIAARGTEQRTGRYEATQGLDILMAIFLLFSTALLVTSYWTKEPHGQQENNP